MLFLWFSGTPYTDRWSNQIICHLPLSASTSQTLLASSFTLMLAVCEGRRNYSWGEKGVHDIPSYHVSQRGMLTHFSCCWQGDKEHSELPAKRQWIAVISNERKTSYCQLYCETFVAMEGHLINWFCRLFKLKFVSLLDFEKFKNWCEKLPATAYESLLKSYT
jgi:hypothetical protein